MTLMAIKMSHDVTILGKKSVIKFIMADRWREVIIAFSSLGVAVRANTMHGRRLLHLIGGRHGEI